MSEDARTWIYAFIILVIGSLFILTLRIIGNPFLATDFEVVVIYIPTALAGVAALHATRTPE